MLIRKKYKFEAGHIVRNCSTEKCKYSIHGHSYKIEVLFYSKRLDNAGMVVDFGLLSDIKNFIESFDHSYIFWDKDNEEYIKFIKKFSKRWVKLNVNPSAEMLSLVFFKFINYIIKHTEFKNNENFELYSIIVHETDSGYAQCFKEDLDEFDKKYNIDISFSSDILNDWKENSLYDVFYNDCKIIKEKPKIQIKE